MTKNPGMSRVVYCFMEFHENPAHAQTVDTRPFFFLPHAKRAVRLPAREKRGTGDEAKSQMCISTACSASNYSMGI